MTDAQTRSVRASASGSDAINASSPGVVPLCTSAESRPEIHTTSAAGPIENSANST